MDWQMLLVGIIVAAALLFAIWRLPGKATRLRYVSWMRRLSGGRGPLARLAWRFESQLRRDDSPCSGCSAADSHAPPRAATQRNP
jgi:hypothetical protein